MSEITFVRRVRRHARWRADRARDRRADDRAVREAGRRVRRERDVGGFLLGLVDDLAGRDTRIVHVDQRTHSLQTAALARAAGADDEVVFAALFHDAGKVLRSGPIHGKVAATLVAPFVHPDVADVVAHHSDFTAATFADDLARREKHRPRPWFALAEEFDRWDIAGSDPGAPTPRLDEFGDLVQSVVAGPYNR